MQRLNFISVIFLGFIFIGEFAGSQTLQQKLPPRYFPAENPNYVSPGNPVSSSTMAQDSTFVIRSGSKLFLDDRPYYSIGVNCYYLQNLAAYGDTFHIEEVFREAKSFGVNTIRTWGFFDAPDSNNSAVIQYYPGRYNEHGLRALDYIIAKAREYSIRLIIPLVNNWEHYGGMNQYVRWYNQQLPTRLSSNERLKQKLIMGTEGRYYEHYISTNLTHDDFYTNSHVKEWYKNYITMLTSRLNSVTGVRYRDDPTILMWELANEPRSLDRTGTIIVNWLDEMSTFLKTTDPNHLISTGEEGLDISDNDYSDPWLYNDQTWFFDGSAGISFQRNIALPNIDVGSIHCYPEAWKLTAHHGIRWLSDHENISNRFDKPLIVGEVGKWSQGKYFFEGILNEALYGRSVGVLLWQFVYDGRVNNDGYAIYYPKDSITCAILQSYADRYRQRADGTLPVPLSAQLLPNYPNPFNQTTLIPYDVISMTHVRLDIVAVAGQRVTNLVDEIQFPGHHIIPFDGIGLGSGVYFIHLITTTVMQSRKIILLR